LLGGVESQTESANERETEDTSSKPSFVVWGEIENASRPTTGDMTTVAGVVADKLFQKAKFVDLDFDLGYDETDGTICKFVMSTNCNLQANIDVCTWWKEARKWIPTYISRLQNDKSAMKWAFLGIYSVVAWYKNRGMANKYDLISNIGWLTKHAKIQHARFKDIIVTVDHSMNEVWQQGRRNTKMYDIFFDNYLPCVIKKSVFDCQVCVATNNKTLCTVSDEAFALLLLENSFDRWIDIYRLRKGQVTPKQGQKHREFESDIPTKYTEGGIVYNQTDKNNDPKGWSALGIKRYNELFEIVRKDRKTHGKT
jgi:hypothetical protein